MGRIPRLARCPTPAQLRKSVLPACLPDLVNLGSLTSLVVGDDDGQARQLAPPGQVRHRPPTWHAAG